MPHVVMSFPVASHVRRLALLIALGACTEIGTDPKAAVAIEFDPTQLPALVAGDTLRDSLGVAVRLSARAFNSKNDLIADAPIRFIPGDSSHVVQIDSVTGYVIGLQPGVTSAIASIGGLQSQRVTLRVTTAPEFLVSTDTSLTDTLKYVVGTGGTFAMNLRVERDSAGVRVPVPNWLVKFHIIGPPGIETPPIDTARVVFLADESRRLSRVDTTDASGAVKRQLVISSPALATRPDSVAVEAYANAPNGTPLAGSPVHYTILIRAAASVP